ncbi:MAG: ABC transporter substrate-binding protein [Alphaproteobacteria bacterium]
MKRHACAVVMAVLMGFGGPAAAVDLLETPLFAEQVKAGALPPVHERVPAEPSVVTFDGDLKPGKPGGELRTLIPRAKDVRLMMVYGYARLVGYDRQYNMVPDIAASFTVEEGRIFTFKLRPGHKWSDGAPFTVDDIRYWWEDVANNDELSPSGPPVDLLVDGQPPEVEFVDEVTVRFTWAKPNPFFLPRIAGASPLLIYRPKHYLKDYHVKYADPAALEAALKEARRRNWASLHNRLDNLYRFDNPDLPTLQPWVNRTKAPATRFIVERNPYYHRVDAAGHQLPYIDRVILNVADGKLIPAKAGTGEADLQARNLAFNNYTFLRENEEQGNFKTRLWRTAKGAHIALYPNLNINDPAWRELMRDVRFRRALSMGIDREIINETLYFGLALEANNTLLPDSPLYNEDYQTRWAEYDPDAAEALLDEIGLDQRNDNDIRLLPDGRPLEIIVETAGESTEQTDVLELVREDWERIGIKLFIKPSQREVFRNRVFAGESQMAVWSGWENGVASPEMSPSELAPTTQQGLQWPKWGQFYETKGHAGEPPDMPEAEELMALNQRWLDVSSIEERRAIWERMLEIHADNVFVIGIIAGVQQPVVVKNDLVNVPVEGVYNWDPGAQFGIYRPDIFWLDR